MKFTDGQWLLQPGVRAHYATEARSITAEDGRLVVVAPARPINDRGDTLQGPILTIILSSPLPDIVRVRIEHFTGGPLRGPQVPLVPQADTAATINHSAEGVTLTAGELTARVGKKRWAITFEAGGRVLTTSGWRGMSYMQTADRGNHVVEQLSLGVGENVYGVDAIKTDFGERIPTEGVVYYDGSDPVKMHNFYPIIYNETVFRAIEAGRGSGEAVLFARSSYTSGQRFPVHWGGDCWSTFESMAESLRGGLSLGLSGFGFWSHDIGGFEGTAPAFIYKRWAAFGLLSSHSRLHGSGSYRIPWAYDDEACDVLRLFTKLKCRLMPYLWSAALQAHREGVPMMRAMVLEFPGDPGCEALDRQYMLGDSLLVAPVFTEDGAVDYYLPPGRWANLLTGQVQEGPGWHRERHGFLSLPLMVRPNTVLPLGAADNRPDYDYAAGVTFRVYEPADGAELICDVSTPQRSESVRFSVHRAGKQITARVAGDPSARWQLQLAGMHVTSAENGARIVSDPLGIMVGPAEGSNQIELTIFTRDCCLDTRVQSPESSDFPKVRA
ncbi:MAG: TIM-barrel domain-containing protein, partial [Terrimicrobiaceae bacterium]